MPLLSAKEFFERESQRKLENSPATLCGCGCGKPLVPQDGTKHMIVVGKEVEVNEDCYWEKLGELVEAYPIGPPSLRRSG